MRRKRLIQQLRLCLINNPYKRADYLRKNGVFHHVGENVSFQPLKMPLYGELISIGDNVVIGSNVSFLTHDGYHAVCNRVHPEERVNEKGGCIKIGNNCFIGANSNLMNDIFIGNDTVVAAGATVTKDIPSGEIWGGCPAHCIGYTKELHEKYKNNIKISVLKESLSQETVKELWLRFQEKRA